MELRTKRTLNDEKKITGYEISIKERFERIVTCSQGAYNDGEWKESPPYQSTREDSREIYSQEIEEIDLEAIILAVNGIKEVSR